MLRLATQKRRLKAKVQELSDDDILEVESGPQIVVPSAKAEPATAEPAAAVIESRSRIVAFPSYAHDAPTSPFVGRIDSWKLPPPPRLPVLPSFLARAPNHSNSSVPPMALPAATIPRALPSTRKFATVASSVTATQKIRAALGDATEHTLLVVQGRPSIAWAAALLAAGMCFGAFLARPGRSEVAAATQIIQESAAPEIIMAAAPTRAPTVAEVAVPVVIVPAAPASPAPVDVKVAPAPVAPPKVVAAAKKTPAPPAKKAVPEPAARAATKDPSVADALAREQLKSALR